MKKVYNFRLNKGDDEVKEILEKRVGSESNFIKSAILFYGKFGEKIDSMAAEIKELRAIVENGNFTAAVKEKRPASENPDDKFQTNIDAEKIIADSIRDILNL
ncbi:MAG: hypothetical protein PWQ60_2393 [Thermoanaerobacteraceae bacterium]|nr:hypothetical protein [Thermoanaerobacteraceae bacterium]